MNNRFCSTLAAAVVTVASLAAPALADDGATKTKLTQRVDDVFARLDADKDGKISKAEASKGRRLSKKFDEVDADHDGFVTKAELSTAMAHHAHAKS